MKALLCAALAPVVSCGLVVAAAAGEPRDQNQLLAAAGGPRPFDRAAVSAEIASRWSGRLDDGAAELGVALLKASPETLIAAREASTVAALDAALFGRPLLPQTVGDALSDLVFFPVTPCRLADTRSATAGILAAGVPRDFDANGANLSTQGGSATGCGVVEPDPAALVLTITAVGPAGAGNLRAWATTGPVPNASVVNYALPGQGLNLANTTILPILQSVANVNEFTIRADVSAVHVVVDVVGYFDRANLSLPDGSASSILATGGSLPGFFFSGVNIVPTRTLSCFVTADLAWIVNGGPPATGQGYVKTARREVITGTNTEDAGFFNYIGALGDNMGTASKSSIWQLTVGGIYQFGCSATGTGDFVGDNVFCSVTWSCR